jgi:predicted nucleotidyltransferase
MEFQLSAATVLAVVVGSRAYGLETEASDTDRRGVFVAPTPLFWRFDKPPAHVEGPLPEQFSWEVERFCALALEGNPTVLECLWSPIVERSSPAGDELREMRQAFLSEKAVRTFARYADRQFRRFGERTEPREAPDDPGEAPLGQGAACGGPEGAAPMPGEPPRASRETPGDPRRWKTAMHAIRLMLSAVHLARHGEPLVRVDAHRDRLLAVRRGELSWPEVLRWRGELAARLDQGGRMPLPQRPDRDRVEEFLIRVRRSAL